MELNSELAGLIDSIRDSLSRGESRRIGLPGVSDVQVFVDGHTRTFGLFLRHHGTRQIVPQRLSRFISMSEVAVDTAPHAVVGCSSTRLFDSFFALATSVLRHYQTTGRDAVLAVEGALEENAALIAQQPALSGREARGLWGELCVLHSLAAIHGRSSLECWVGVRGDDHDFRVNQSELEVKTTSRRLRVHRISSLTQLSPSLGKQLFIVSVRVRNGPGANVRDLISECASCIGCEESEIVETIENGLGVALSADGGAELSTKYVLADLPRTIRVDAALPVITRPHLLRWLGQAGHRIEAAEYDLNCEDLGSDLSSGQLEGLSIANWPRSVLGGIAL